MPRPVRKSTAAPRPTTSVMGGVPASNLAGSSARGEAVEADVGDHVAATEERWHRVEQFLAAPQHADARRAAHLVAAERHEVGAPRLHVGDVVRHVLAAVDDGDRAGGVCGGAQLLHRGDACRARCSSR